MRALAIVLALCVACGALSCRFNTTGLPAVPAAPGDLASTEPGPGPFDVARPVDAAPTDRLLDGTRTDRAPADRPPLDKPKPPPDKPPPDHPWPCGSSCAGQKCCYNTSSTSWSCLNQTAADHCLCDPVSQEPCKTAGKPTNHTTCARCSGAYQCWQTDLLANCIP